jgi:protein-tyrosine phosphatase
MGATFTILTVCTANVCRSPLAEAVLTQWAGTHPEVAVTVGSAGVDAEPGQPMCPQSAALAHPGDPSAATHQARELTADLLAGADLVLVADRTHRSAAARLAPRCRPRLFTLTQAADLAEAVAAHLQRGELPEGAPSLPTVPEERLRWLVAEMDAARGVRAGLPDEADDIPDDHGQHPHEATLQQVRAAAARIAAAMNTVLG